MNSNVTSNSAQGSSKSFGGRDKEPLSLKPEPYPRAGSPTKALNLQYDCEEDSQELSKEVAFEKHSFELDDHSDLKPTQDDATTEPLTRQELMDMEAALLRDEEGAAGIPVEQMDKFADDKFDDHLTAGQKPFMSGNPMHDISTQLHDLVPGSTEEYQDAWSDLYVKLACSPQNTYRQVTDMSTPLMKWDLIKTSLTAPINSSKELEEAIMSYNPSFVGKWNFSGLHALINRVLTAEERAKFFTSTLPAMVGLAVQLPELLKRPIPLLSKWVDAELILSQQQVACLLANSFFCTYPRRSNAKAVEYNHYPSINFNTLFSSGGESKLSKLRCIVHYFERMAAHPEHFKAGRITFRRQVLEEFPEWGSLDACTLPDVEIRSDGTIEDDGINCIQIDFANKMIGGGVLGEGCVQEEIRFVINPECLVSRLFTAELEPNECLIITGAERFCRYTGYRSSFAFAGDYLDTTPRDKHHRIQTVIVGIDAVHLRSPTSQYRKELVLRELNKAYCGFFNSATSVELPYHRWPIATGNWGCGAFGGHKEAKSLIQLMAAAPLRKKVLYFTFGEVDFELRFRHIYSILITNKITVKGLYDLFELYWASLTTATASGDLFSFILRRLGASAALIPAEPTHSSSPIELTP